MIVELPGAIRLLAHFAQGEELAKFSDQDRHYGAHIMKIDAEHPANCVTSGPMDGESFHMPILDDDQGLFRVVPSRTPGHNHVYIDKAIRWRDFVRLLELLAELEIVDPKWARLSIDQLTATLRLPNGEVMTKD